MFAKEHAVDIQQTFESPSRDRIDQILKWSLITIIGTAVVCIVGLVVDDRRVLGDLVWLKPLKFSISIALYTATFRWIRNRLPHNRVTDAAAVISTLALVVEEALVGLQAARAVRSHFNNETAFDGTIYNLMAGFVALVFISGIALTWSSFRRPPHDPIIRPIVRGGSLVILLGMVVGIVMTSMPPTAATPPNTVGAHSVGGLDGSGESLAIVGWSTSHGDLRPGHFIGLHALQALIIVAAFGRRRGWTTLRLRRVIKAVTIAFGGATVFLAVQALASTPIVDRSTWILVAICGALVGSSLSNLPPSKVPVA
jgi:hypothetical protein